MSVAEECARLRERRDLELHLAVIRYHTERLAELAVECRRHQFASAADKVTRSINRIEREWLMVLDDLEAVEAP